MTHGSGPVVWRRGCPALRWRRWHHARFGRPGVAVGSSRRMAFYAELRGSSLASRAGSEPYIVQGSVSYESAVGERPIARCQVRVPAGATNPDPRDFDEFTLDYPAKPYRAVALALNPIHYWTLDEGPVHARNRPRLRWGEPRLPDDRYRLATVRSGLPRGFPTAPPRNGHRRPVTGSQAHSARSPSSSPRRGSCVSTRAPPGSASSGGPTPATGRCVPSRTARWNSGSTVAP